MLLILTSSRRRALDILDLSGPAVEILPRLREFPDGFVQLRPEILDLGRALLDPGQPAFPGGPEFLANGRGLRRHGHTASKKRQPPEVR